MTARGLTTALALGLAATLSGCDDGAAPNRFQGYVTADFVYVGPEESGRLARLSIDRGSKVRAGDPLFALDFKVYVAERDQAAARLQRAEATLAKLRAARQQPEEIEVLKARARQAQAALTLSTEELARQQRLRVQDVSSVAALDRAQSQFRRDRAALLEVRRQIALARLPARDHDIAVAMAERNEAKAALQNAREKLARRNVTAAVAGIVQDVLYRPGEVVDAGRPVVVLLPPGNLRFRFYVPETRLAAVHVGDIVDVTCDGCTAGLTAKVAFVSTEAEYTPPVIFSPEERRKFVYRVEAVPEGAARSLKPGQPVTLAVRGAPVGQ